MNPKEELDKLEKEMDEFLSPRNERRRELNKIIEQQYDEVRQKEYNDTIAGRFFFGDDSTWSGYKNTIFLIKPISCTDWATYNSCNVLSIEIRLNEKSKQLNAIIIKETTQRVDMFKTHYKELTPEMFEQITGLVNKELRDAFFNFI